MKNYFKFIFILLTFKSLIALEKSKILDDFSFYNYVNQSGYKGASTLYLTANDFIDSGKSLKIDYSIAYNGYIYFEHYFNSSLDLSDYDAISFYIKSLDNPLGEYLQFSVITSSSDYFRHIDYFILKYTNWQRLKISLRELKEGNEHLDGFVIDPWLYKSKKWDLKNVIGYRLQIVNYGMNGLLTEDRQLHKGSVLIDNLIAFKNEKEENIISDVVLSPPIITPNNDNINDNLKVKFELADDCYIEIKIYDGSGNLIKDLTAGKKYYEKGSQFILIKPD